MLARIRKQLEENKEQGFTLVELLVVIIIIGILAAIAIPIYLNQQAKAKDSSAKADLASYRTIVAAAPLEDPTLATAAEVMAVPSVAAFVGSPAATSISVVTYTPASGTFCIQETYTGGTMTAISSDQNGVLHASADCSGPAIS